MAETAQTAASAFPQHQRWGSGQELPDVKSSRVPGAETRTWLIRREQVAAPMGPLVRQGDGGFVLATGYGCNVWDPDSNRYVDLAAGFGALLLGHCHPAILRAQELQSQRLMQALGDMYPAESTIALMQRLAGLYPEPGAKVILGLSGADAITAALKTARLATGRDGVIAFEGAYHGLSMGPLALCGLRKSYREPFEAQLNSKVEFLPYPSEEEGLVALERLLIQGRIGAVVVEPILGRGGILALGSIRMQRMAELCRQHGALLVADEIWTGLGRSGTWLCSTEWGVVPDLICLAKGLGGGVPVSACVGAGRWMDHWSQEAEVVHTSTFAGAPLGCTLALAALDVLERGQLVARSRILGERWRSELTESLAPFGVVVRGQGLMVGLDLGPLASHTGQIQSALLGRGFIVSGGGGARSVIVLTPPLLVEQALLAAFTEAIAGVLSELEAP